MLKEVLLWSINSTKESMRKSPSVCLAVSLLTTRRIVPIIVISVIKYISKEKKRKNQKKREADEKKIKDLINKYGIQENGNKKRA
ncbi:hypothetical protein DI43_15195 [Geobacillus sp. CAMR12739]|nr:hypothetical protein DI43_15195 [Geobacillus sp. CAMR12739]